MDGLHEEFGQEGFHTNSNLVPSSKCRRRNVGNVDENQSSPFFWEESEKLFQHVSDAQQVCWLLSLKILR